MFYVMVMWMEKNTQLYKHFYTQKSEKCGVILYLALFILIPLNKIN